MGLDTKLKELGFNGPQTAAAIGTIIGRACEPATRQWLQECSGLGELTGYDYGNLSLYAMYQISDQLLGKKAASEQHLYQQERSLFGLQETITLYDLTNTYFEGQCKTNALAVSRKKHREFDKTESTVVKENDGYTVRVQKVFDEETQETLLYCHSSMREKKDQAIDDRFTTRLEEDLQKLDHGLSQNNKRYIPLLG